MKSEKHSISIKTWSPDDRPREKLATQGSRTLSNAELLAILIGSGNRHESAVELGKRIMASVDHSLHDLGKMTLGKLKSFDGIGQAKGITPEQCARKMIRAMKRNRKDVLIGRSELVMVWIHKYCKWLYYRLLNKVNPN